MQPVVNSIANSIEIESPRDVTFSEPSPNQTHWFGRVLKEWRSPGCSDDLVCSMGKIFVAIVIIGVGLTAVSVTGIILKESSQETKVIDLGNKMFGGGLIAFISFFSIVFFLSLCGIMTKACCMEEAPRTERYADNPYIEV